jgi:hypothetical protein
MGPLLLWVAACHSPTSVLDISSPGHPFTRIEVFFVDAAYDRVTDPAKVPHSTPNVPGRSSAPDAELWIRKFDPADIFTTDSPVTLASLGIPANLGVGPYLAVVASDASGPVAYAEVLDYRDHDVVKYELELAPITLATPPPLVGSKLTLLAPCGPGSVSDVCGHNAFNMNATMATVTSPSSVIAHVHGVMEGATYHNGTPGVDGWYIGNQVTLPVGSTAFHLGVSSPANNYWLNYRAVPTGDVEVFDYFVAFPVDPGARLDFGATDQDGIEFANQQQLAAGTANDPYAGEYAQVDIVGVKSANDVGSASPWPAGAEVWSRPATAPACLRLTTTTGTHFVAASGDADCDGFADQDADCDPTAYCDPMASPAGCYKLCDESLDDNGDQELRLGVCIDGLAAKANAGCPSRAAPPSYCVAEESACMEMSPLATHEDMLACVMTHHPDMDCTTYFDNTGSACTSDLAVAVGSGACTDVAVLARTTSGLAVNATTSNPCTIQLTAAVGLSAGSQYILIGMPTAAGGFDTVSVKVAAMTAPDGMCKPPTCGPLASDAPHQCR